MNKAGVKLPEFQAPLANSIMGDNGIPLCNKNYRGLQIRIAPEKDQEYQAIRIVGKNRQV